MKKMNYLRLVYCLALTLFIGSCAPTIDESSPAMTSEADFSKYIAIGNSLTAGYMDGGLYLEGQQSAYPNLIAQQMKMVGGGSFHSPLFATEQANGTGYLRIASFSNGIPVTEQVTDKLGLRSTSPLLYTKYSGQIENFGVPGMRIDMVDIPGLGTAAGNPYFERLLADNDLSTYQMYTTTKSHTFFSFWLGNNDALGYATNGGVTSGATSVLTSEAVFREKITKFIEGLTSTGQKGVVGTIPEVTVVPFFNTVTVQSVLNGVNAALRAQGKSEVSALYIATKGSPRIATEKDLLILPFSAKIPTIGTLNGAGAPYALHGANPIEDHYVLDEQEVALVKSRVYQFNQIIRDVANNKGLALADAYMFLNNLKAEEQEGGLTIDGIKVTTAYVSGNAFSLDGVHLTPIGSAIMANVFIHAINMRYKAAIPPVDITQYRGVKLP